MCIIKFDLFYMFPVNCDDVTVFVKVYFESKCTNCIFPTSKGGGGGSEKKKQTLKLETTLVVDLNVDIGSCKKALKMTLDSLERLAQ